MTIAEHKKYFNSLIRTIKHEINKHYSDEGYLIEKIDKLKETAIYIAKMKRMKK